MDSKWNALREWLQGCHDRSQVDIINTVTNDPNFSSEEIAGLAGRGKQAKETLMFMDSLEEIFSHGD